MDVKRMVCLANSRKPPSGRCLAGKEVLETGFGPWIRPVSSRPTREISEEERRYENGQDVRVLDIVDVPLKEALPERHQRENYLIDDGYYWSRAGRCSLDELAGAVDEDLNGLWTNESSSTYGMKDRVAEAALDEIDNSLLLVRPEELQIKVAVEGGGLYPKRRRVRARFQVGDHQYLLAVTDPPVERRFLGGEDGVFTVGDDIFMCVSLAEEFHGYAYKVVASIVTPDRAEA